MRIPELLVIDAFRYVEKTHTTEEHYFASQVFVRSRDGEFGILETLPNSLCKAMDIKIDNTYGVALRAYSQEDVLRMQEVARTLTALRRTSPDQKVIGESRWRKREHGRVLTLEEWCRV